MNADKAISDCLRDIARLENHVIDLARSIKTMQANLDSLIVVLNDCVDRVGVVENKVL